MPLFAVGKKRDVKARNGLWCIRHKAGQQPQLQDDLAGRGNSSSRVSDLRRS